MTSCQSGMYYPLSLQQMSSPCVLQGIGRVVGGRKHGLSSHRRNMAATSVNLPHETAGGKKLLVQISPSHPRLQSLQSIRFTAAGCLDLVPSCPEWFSWVIHPLPAGIPLCLHCSDEQSFFRKSQFIKILTLYSLHLSFSLKIKIALWIKKYIYILNDI